MTKTALKALKQSIEHWERLASGDRELDEDIGPNNCSLCAVFWKLDASKPKKERVKCNGCPVKEKTGKFGCRDTPYDDASDMEIDFGLDSPEFKEAAKKELEFLKSLLP